MAEDIIRGRNTVPKTLNRYGYCWENPVGYIDINGEDPITPQDVQKGFWDSLLSVADQAFVNKVEDIQNTINEGLHDVADTCSNRNDSLCRETY